MRPTALKSFAILSLFSAGCVLSAAAQSYNVTNLVSDGSVTAVTMDPNFLNPWAISVSGTWWISTANTGFNFVIPPATKAIAFKVIIPSAKGSGPGTPTGSVTTAGASGMILPNGTKASFLFSTLDGTIAGWNSKLGTNNAVTQIAIDNSSAGASYTGLAILNANATTSYILAPDFGTATIEVYDSSFKPTKLSGSFTDPNLPSGYSPFSIHILNNQVWVGYAVRTATAPYDTVDALGNGIVDVFDSSGNFVNRAVTGGNLNSPWGVAFAPANFGIFSNDLLIGNLGDGKINVYDPKTFAYLGQLMDSTGKSLTYESLWELLPGGTAVGNSTAVSGGDLSTVYFTAGLADEKHGLLAAISNGTVANSSPTFGFTAAADVASVTAGDSVQATVSVAPANGFSGSVSFACSGLPTGAVCHFTPTTVSVTPTAAVTSQLTITTTPGMTATLRHPNLGARSTGLTLAFALPFSALLFVRRSRRFIAPLCAFIVSFAAAVVILGCGTSSSTVQGTPSGQSTITVTATPSTGSSQQTTIGLNVR